MKSHATFARDSESGSIGFADNAVVDMIIGSFRQAVNRHIAVDQPRISFTCTCAPDFTKQKFV